MSQTCVEILREGIARGMDCKAPLISATQNWSPWHV